MSERFVAIRGEVWDQTTLPARRLDIDDARRMAATWDREAQECRRRGAYDLVRVWAMPAASLIAAIDVAVVQRQMLGREREA